MKPGIFVLAGLLWLVAVQPMLDAGSFRVAPVRIDLSARRPYATLRIANAGADTVTVQVDAYEWQIQGGADRYPETDDIIANPPIFTLEPGQKTNPPLSLHADRAAHFSRPVRQRTVGRQHPPW